MLPAPYPADEASRQQALDELELLDTPAELYLDTLVRLARDLFQVESVLISLIDHDRQWFKARIGLDAAQTSRDVSFCGHAVAAGELLVVPDTLENACFRDNPLVSGAPFIRFYAGQPLHSTNGQAIGTLCLLDSAPRILSPQEHQYMQDLATLAEGYLYLRSLSQQTQNLRQAVSREQRKALIDPLTQLWNRAGLEQFFNSEESKARAQGKQLAVIYCDLDHFKLVNDQFGHAAGDQVLWQSARRMSAALRPDDLLVRQGGEEFVALVSVHDEAELQLIAERVRSTISATQMNIGSQNYSISTSIGTAIAGPQDNQKSLLERADSALYLAKQQGRNCTVHLPAKP